MRSGVLNTTERDIISTKSTLTKRRDNGCNPIIAAAVALILAPLIITVVAGLTIPAGNNGASGGSLPSLDDLTQFVDHFEDELIGHNHDTPAIPTSLEEDVPHPIKVNNWAHDLNVGQIGGVSVNPSDQPVIFHRGPVEWNARSFELTTNNLAKPRTRIDEDTILTLDPDTGNIISSFGKDMFYMPHGITIDADGNTYVTDVGLHQVMRFPAGKKTPDLVLGVAFESGQDANHFCKPTAVAVSERTGDFFVADGYCNSRILKFSSDGKLKQIIDGNWKIPHSLALFEESDVLCVANREGQNVDCMKAGLQRPLYANRDETGQKVNTYNGVGRVYAIAGKGTALLTMSGSPNVRGLTIDTAADEPAVIDEWGKNDGIKDPHDIAISLTGDAIYVAMITPGKANLHKYDVMTTDSNIDKSMMML